MSKVSISLYQTPKGWLFNLMEYNGGRPTVAQRGGAYHATPEACSRATIEAWQAREAKKKAEGNG